MGIELLVMVLVIAVIAFVAIWLIDNIGLPNPINMIAKAIVVIILLVFLLQKTGILA